MLAPTSDTTEVILEELIGKICITWVNVHTSETPVGQENVSDMDFFYKFNPSHKRLNDIIAGSEG